jgi:hypothetical protein
MPEKRTLERARADKKAGKAPSTQAGEFIREQIDHIREGRHGARSTKQAIAIGLSEARRAGVDLPPPRAGKASNETRKRAARDYARGHGAAPRRTAGCADQGAPCALGCRTQGGEVAKPLVASRAKSPANPSRRQRQLALLRLRGDVHRPNVHGQGG